MEQGSCKPLFIQNKLAATIGVILTGLVVTQLFHDVFLHPGRHSNWFPVFRFNLPNWELLVINGAFYGYLLWGSFALFRMAQDKERIVIVGWCIGVLLDPIKNFVSTPWVIVIQWVQAVAIVAAFLAALNILLRFLANYKAHI